MKTSLLIEAACAASFGLTAASIAGTVTLLNGDSIEGEVVSNSDTGVQVNHEDLGTLNIAADNVAGLQLSNADPAYTGAPEGGWFFPGWDKSIKAGFSGSAGNTENLNIYGAFDTGYEDEKDRWQVDATFFYTEDGSVNTRNELMARVIKDWLLPGEKYFYWAIAQAQMDRFTAWEDRVSGYVGVGYEWINRPDDLLVVGRAGIGGAYEGGNVNEFTPELFLGVEAEWTINDQSSLSAFTYFYPSLDPFFEEFRNSTGLTYKLAIATARGMSLELGIRNEYDSKVDAPLDDNDFKYFGALVYDF